MISPHQPAPAGDVHFNNVDATSYQLSGNSVIDSSQNIIATSLDAIILNTNKLNVGGKLLSDKYRNITAKSFTGYDVNVNTLHINGKLLFDNYRNANVNSLNVNGTQVVDNNGNIFMNNFYSLMIPMLTSSIQQGLTTFKDLDMSHQNLINVNLSGANLFRTNLNGSNLSGANLSGANLTGANLTNVNLSGSNLTRANFTRANLTGVIYNNTIFGNTYVENALLFENTLLDTSGSDWVQSELPSSSIQLNNNAAYIMSLSGDGLTMVVGSPNYSDGENSSAGQVVAYMFANNEWVQKGSPLIGSQYEEHFGSTISLNENGNIVAVGSPLYSVTSNSAEGQVKIYEFSGGNWLQKGSTIQGSVREQCGSAISLTDNGLVVAIGFPQYSNGNNTGKVTIYDFSGNAWNSIGTQTGNSSGDLFGSSVKINGNGTIVAVGSPYANSQTGFVTVYDFSANIFTQKGAPIIGSVEGEVLGMNISLSKNGLVLAICSPSYRNITPVIYLGQVVVYKYDNGINDWAQVGLPIIGTQKGENIGSSASLSSDGTILAIGSTQYSYNGYTNAGRILVYELVGSIWTQQGTPIIGTSANQHVGSSVSLNKNGNKKTIAIGSTKYNNMFYTYSRLATGTL
jgi:uncharacterized protein YjbI with pentapeptide repeats